MIHLTVVANNGAKSRKVVLTFDTREAAELTIKKSYNSEVQKFRKKCGLGLENLNVIDENHKQAVFKPVVILFPTITIDYIITE